MKKFILLKITLLVIIFFVFPVLQSNGRNLTGIYYTDSGNRLQQIAAKELRRYWYLRTGEFVPVAEYQKSPDKGSKVIILTGKNSVIAREFTRDLSHKLGPQQFGIRSILSGNGQALLLVGGDDIATYYAASKFIEHMGVRFSLYSDIIPENKLTAEEIDQLFSLEEINTPVFDKRGILPFHDFPAGPDWWELDDYKVIFNQLAKMRMNFFGLHTYPESNPATGPELNVWIGFPQDIKKNGEVKYSYKAGYATTRKAWRYHFPEVTTSEWSGGASQLFETDHYGSTVLRGFLDWPQESEAQNEAFNRTGRFFNEAFTFARSLGIKIAVGTESPIHIPEKVLQRGKELGYDTQTRIIRDGRLKIYGYDSVLVRKIYQGIFERIEKTMPIDYYWLWTDEYMMGDPDQSEELVNSIKRDILHAYDAIESSNYDFRLATCGWDLGPVKDRTMLDRVLPKDIPFSGLNRGMGKVPVTPEFAGIRGRDKWAIPWLEDDGNILGAQLWFKRMYRDAIDAWRYGCNGLIGIHWRTQILSPNIAALQRAGWDSGMVSDLGSIDPDNEKHRETLIEKLGEKACFDWAKTHFGEEIAEEVTQIYMSIDGEVFETGMGIGYLWFRHDGDKRNWTETKNFYQFIEELEGLRPLIKTPGSLERFDFWLNTWRYEKAAAELGFAMPELSGLVKEMNKITEMETKRVFAREKVLPERIRVTSLWNQAFKFRLMSLNTKGALGTIADLELIALRRSPEHNIGSPKTPFDNELKELLGGNLPENAVLDDNYQGPSRIIVPTIRTTLEADEDFSLKILVLNDEGAKSDVSFFWRKMGTKKFSKIKVNHVARGVYQLNLTNPGSDFEYFIESDIPDKKVIKWPVTAGKLNQTVVCLPE